MTSLAYVSKEDYDHVAARCAKLAKQRDHLLKVLEKIQRIEPSRYMYDGYEKKVELTAQKAIDKINKEGL